MAVDLDAQGLGYFGVVLAEESRLQITRYEGILSNFSLCQISILRYLPSTESSTVTLFKKKPFAQNILW